MANGKFYHVFITPKTGVDLEAIKTQMNLALDWFKYDKNNWVLYSNASMDKLMTRFKPLVEPEGRLFICELNTSNRNGWMNKDFWEWLKKNRDK
ncbi:MAG: hypothetical protein JNK61_00070 [Bacteroidia bacterium]|nr:hypothetical protein [Bacteroidia bacterium]